MLQCKLKKQNSESPSYYKEEAMNLRMKLAKGTTEDLSEWLEMTYQRKDNSKYVFLGAKKLVNLAAAAVLQTMA